MDDSYAVRRYEPADREGFQTLFERVFGHAFTDEAFEWKFERNPYVPDVPVLLAETDGEVVGARAFFGHRIRAGDRTVLGLQGTDAMVHPDHRGRGVYGRLVQYTTEYYADREAALRFTFPNRVSLPGNVKHGARIVGTVPTYYRIRSPTALLGSDDTLRTRIANRIASPLARRYLDARERFAPESDEGVRIERHADPPAADLGSLYERTVPDALHTVRDARFYRWRFGNPEWDYTTYTAVRGETTVGGVIVGTQRREGALVSRLTDVLPMGRGSPGRTAVRARLLETVVAEHRDADTIAAFGNGVGRGLLGTYGFLSDHRLPLSHVSTRTPIVVRPLSSDPSETSINGFDATDRKNWTLSYSDWDAS